LAGWLKSIGFQILYELDHRKPVLYVVPADYILGKLPLVPVGDTGTIKHHPRNLFQGAPGNSRAGAGDECKMWFVNSWAMAAIAHETVEWRGPVKCNEWEREFSQYQPPYTTLICRFVPIFIRTFMTIIAIMYQE
jgi:hypothetical protein